MSTDFFFKESCVINTFFTFIPCFVEIIYLYTHIHMKDSGGTAEEEKGGKHVLKPII